MSLHQRKKLYHEFESLASRLVLMNHEAPDVETVKITEMVIRELHFILLKPVGDFISEKQSLKLAKVFVKHNLPSLILSELPYISPQDRKDYTDCMTSVITLYKYDLEFVLYILDSQFIHDVLLGHGLPTTVEYCSRILGKLMEHLFIKEEVVANPYFTRLASYAEDPNFQIQEHSLKTLKVIFEDNGGAHLVLPHTFDFITALTGIINTQNLVLKAQSIEVLAHLLNSQKKLSRMFASKKGRIADVLKTLAKDDLNVKRSVLMLLSVFLDEEEPVPLVLKKNRHILKDTHKMLVYNGIDVQLFHNV